MPVSRARMNRSLVACAMLGFALSTMATPIAAFGDGVPTPGIYPVAYAGSGGTISFDPPLGEAHGTGTINITYGDMFGCSPNGCEAFQIPIIQGTYEGDCEYAFLELPNTAESAGHLWGGSVLQATGIKVIVPSHVILLNALSIAVPDEPCNESHAEIAATTFVGNIPD